METKAFWKSKTFWVNLISLAALAVQTQTGFVVSAELQAAALTVVNLGLRAITRDAVGLR